MVGFTKKNRLKILSRALHLLQPWSTAHGQVPHRPITLPLDLTRF